MLLSALFGGTFAVVANKEEVRRCAKEAGCPLHKALYGRCKCSFRLFFVLVKPLVFLLSSTHDNNNNLNLIQKQFGIAPAIVTLSLWIRSTVMA